jgi:uncharacterized membrane protein
MPRWHLALGLLAAAAYAAASHLLMLHAADRPWAIVALLGPLLLLGFGIAWRRRNAAGAVLLAAAALALALVAARGGIGDVTHLYLLQHAGIHLLLFVVFAASLRPGRVPLIGRLAARVHGTLSLAQAAYARKVTVLWAGYFVVMALASVVVYALCRFSTWSLLANLVTPLAIAGLFVGEYLLRYRLHPEFTRASLADGWRAYRHGAR